MYAQPQFLNPQGSDLAKGLLTFAEGKPLGNDGAWWLAVHRGQYVRA
jgi:DNA-directed RNA polymerase